MRVLHIGNIGNNGHQLKVGMRALGHEAEVWDLAKFYIDYPCDGVIVEKVKELGEKAFDPFDALAFHWPVGAPAGFWEKATKDKIVSFHHHGTATRTCSWGGMGIRPDLEFVSGPDLLHWVPDGIFQPIAAFPREKAPKREGPIRIIHCPTSNRKGTEQFLTVIEILRAKGLEFEFDLISGKSHVEIIQEMRDADIILDQWVNKFDHLNPSPVGQFGGVSLEAMSLGRAAIAYVDDRSRKFYEGLPIPWLDCREIGTHLEGILSEFIVDKSTLYSLQDASWDYMQKNHRIDEYAKRVIAEYERIW